VREEYLPAAITGHPELTQDLAFGSFGDFRAVEVGAFPVCIALELLQSLLVVEPFIGKKLPAIHATNWNNHLYRVDEVD